MVMDVEARLSDDGAGDLRDHPEGGVIFRHTLAVRLAHWVNVLCIVVLVMSGLQIFNAHPHLYWGQKGANFDHAILSIDAVNTPNGPRGVTRVGTMHFDTTGFLGWSKLVARAWPSWLTIPSWQDLATGRRWHFLFAWLLVANGFVYLAWGAVSRHLARDLWPRWRDLKGIGRSIVDHIKLKHPKGDEAKRYNVLQKLAYLGVILLIATMVLTGLTMSPGFDAAAPWLLDLFGGRQSARTIHFIAASLIVLFVFVHVIEAILAGPINELRSMITGRYAVRPEDPR